MTISTLERARARTKLPRMNRASDQGAKPKGRGARLIALSVLVALVMTALAGIFGAATANAADDDKSEDAGKYSFYKVTSLLTAMTSNVMSPDAKAKDVTSFQTNWAPVLNDSGAAGSLLSYADPGFFDLKGWGMSGLSMASTNVSYDKLRLQDGDGDKEIPASKQGMLGYAYYGKALSELGIDTAKTGGGFDIVRPVGGGLMFTVYAMGWAVDELFNGVIDLLKLLNPFRLFYDAISSTDAGATVGSAWGPFSGVAKLVSDIYKMVSNIAWGVIVPLFLATFVIGLFLFKKMDRGGALKRLVIRIFFIGVGVPLLAMLYTASLNAVAGDNGKPRENASSSVVGGTYVDFGAWAERSRLKPPMDGGSPMIVITPDGKVSTESYTMAREQARAINKMGHPIAFKNLAAGSGGELGMITDSFQDMTQEQGSSSGSAFFTSMNMLTRYMSGEQISSASFESGFANRMAKYVEDTGGAEKEGSKKVDGWFTEVTQKDETELLENADVAKNPLIKTATGGLNWSAAGGFSSDAPAACFYKVGTDTSCTMSPLAIYNYLNTSFGADSMTMYSSGKASSDLVRKSHMQVNLVGTGIMSLLYWSNSFVLLICFVTIGLVYAIALLFASIRRTFALVGSIPFALLGFLGGIVKTIVFAVALIAEVLMTVVAYMLIQQFLKALPTIIETPLSFLFSNNLASGIGAGLVLAGPIIPMISTIVSIIFIITFTVMALRLRKGMVKAIEEAVSSILNKFVGTSVGPGGGGGGGLGAAAAGLGAAGLGAAAANRMMGGGGGGSPAAAGSEGPGSVGVGGDSAAGDENSENNSALTSNSDQDALEAGDVNSQADTGSTMESTGIDASQDSDATIGGDSNDRADAAYIAENGLPAGNSGDGNGEANGSGNGTGAGGTAGTESEGPAAAPGGPVTNADGTAATSPGVGGSSDGSGKADGANPGSAKDALAGGAAAGVAGKGLGDRSKDGTPGAKPQGGGKPGEKANAPKAAPSGTAGSKSAGQQSGGAKVGAAGAVGSATAKPGAPRAAAAGSKQTQATQQRMQQEAARRQQQGQQPQSVKVQSDNRSTTNVRGGAKSGVRSRMTAEQRTSAGIAMGQSAAASTQRSMQERAARRKKGRDDLMSN